MTNPVMSDVFLLEKDVSLIQAAETLDRAANILRLMAAEEESDPGAITGYYVDAPSSLPVVEGSSASIIHVEPQDWPEGERIESKAEAAHATHVWDGDTQSCVKCGTPHPVFIAQGWPVCPNAET